MPLPQNSTSLDIHWFKSSYSEGSNNACVEVCVEPGTVHVRDSKDAQIPGMRTSSESWTAFIGNLTR